MILPPDIHNLVQCPTTLMGLWTPQYGRSDGTSLSRIDYIRQGGFLLRISPSFVAHQLREFMLWEILLQRPIWWGTPAPSHVSELEEDPPARVKSLDTVVYLTLQLQFHKRLSKDNPAKLFLGSWPTETVDKINVCCFKLLSLGVI